MDVLQNYMTYHTCFKIAKTIPDNPEVPASRAAKIIRRFKELHPYNISQKAKIIVETFISTTSKSINGKEKMMVIHLLVWLLCDTTTRLKDILKSKSILM